MISEKTVLILGAGASVPYGYPTALELRKEIITNLIPRLKLFSDEHKSTTDFDNHPYVKQLVEIINVFKYSSTSSIDLFLSRNKKYYDHGKQLITFLLSNYELESKFREDIHECKYDWYFTLYNTLTKDIVSPDDVAKFADNNISIITFNYDRSFEHFMYESLFNSFTSKQEEIHKLMQNFKIIHVYGKLANLQWESSDGVAYRSTYVRDNYNEYCKNIQIIYDERKTKLDEISELISEAQNIFFLGFGFAEENLEAIGLNRSILNIGHRIYGTALDLTPQEILKNVNRIRMNNKDIIPERLHFENCDSLMLLRKYL